MKYREYFTKILLGAEDNDFVMEVLKEEEIKQNERSKHTVKLGIVTEADEEGQIQGCWVTNCKVQIKLQPTILDHNQTSKVWERETITLVRLHYFNDTHLQFHKRIYCHFVL